jgi:hypothetical protein
MIWWQNTKPHAASLLNVWDVSDMHGRNDTNYSGSTSTVSRPYALNGHSTCRVSRHDMQRENVCVQMMPLPRAY